MAELTDLVVSYVVKTDGGASGDAPLKDALEKGYRVLDVLVSTPGGLASVTCVTVVLTKAAQEAVPYKAWGK